MRLFSHEKLTIVGHAKFITFLVQAPIFSVVPFFQASTNMLLCLNFPMAKSIQKLILLYENFYYSMKTCITFMNTGINVSKPELIKEIGNDEGLKTGMN